jgi:UDP-4-keto-6-deoxy-N-acetylglucosamine 4-aminotransferase
MIPYGKQSISEEDIQAVVNVLRSDYLTQGPVIPCFEQAVADYCKAKYAIAVNSGTAALHIACLALGAGPGDYVWTSPISFVASANCALYCGASIDFVDVDPVTGNMSVEQLASKLQQAEKSGTLPKIVIPVHFAGLPCDMQEIHALGKQYGFKIIEDACHALGATYQGNPIGQCQYSDITVFSFHPVKIITTGEGGMAMTQDPELAKQMQMLRSHGITREQNDFIQPADGPWSYEQQLLGFNYRITDIQAALGLSQLAQLDNWVKRRQDLGRRYITQLDTKHTDALLPHDRSSSFHLYIYHCSDEQRHAVFTYLREHEIGVNVHYQPIFKQPYHSKKISGSWPNAEKFYASAITIPLYPQLKDAQQAMIIELLHKTSS